MSRTWHEDDAFWHTFAPAMFGAGRMDAATKEVDDVLALTGGAPGRRVLDTCCGPGRHCLAFARRGLTVTGVDRTQQYLDRAREAALLEGLQVELVHQDIRTFARPGAFDLATNFYTSFGYFEDPAENLAVLRNVHDSLAPGGTFVIDLMGKEVLARIFTPRSWRTMEDGAFMLEERRIRDGWDWIDNRWVVVRGGQASEFRMGHRIYSATELCAMLREAGFARAESFGDLAGAPYDHDADRLVVMATRAT